MIDLKKLEKLIGLMVDNDLTELDLDDGTEKVQLKRGHATGPVQYVSAPSSAPGSPAAAPAVSTGGEPVTAGKGPTIDSPMVGTFYAASSPDSPAFAKVGDSVTADSVVCIIEAMKVFNEIKAEKAGKIKSILVSNGDAVEFGQPLFELE